MKVCGRCDKPIRKGQPYTVHDIFSPSGPGAVVYWHVGWRRRVLIQTTQRPLR